MPPRPTPPSRRHHIAGRSGRISPQPAPTAPQQQPAAAPPAQPIQHEPRWWIRDILVAGVVALIVGGITTAGAVIVQQRIDDNRGERELRAANLAFVRDRSASDQPRPFSRLDLREQSLSELQLQDANLANADLTNASLSSTNLTGAYMVGTTLSGAYLVGANLTGSQMDAVNLNGADAHSAILRDASLFVATLVGTDLSYSDLTGASLVGASVVQANLSGVDLSNTKITDPRAITDNGPSAKFVDICFDEDTQWPDGFSPPPSNPDTCARFSE